MTHKLATDLLGFTPDSLLDEVVEAFASRDGASVFSVVDKVVETGQDPRRFTEDLLRRLRDLVIVTAVPDAPATGLIDVPQDAGERLVAQAARFGAIELSRAADIVAAGLTEMRGATAPRLLLELLCARVLLPGADHTSDGVMARLERLERRLDVTGTPAPAPAAPVRSAHPAPPAPTPAAQDAPAPTARRPRPPAAAAPAAAAPARDEDGPPPPPPMPTSAPRTRRGCRGCRARRGRARPRTSPSPSSRPDRRAASASSTYAACGPTSSSRPRTVAAWRGWCSRSTPTWSTSTPPA